MDLKKKYTASAKTIAERLEHLEKCCEESTKFKLESEKKIASLEKTCEEYKKNIFYLMTNHKSQTNGYPELPGVKRYISQSVMFNYISENIDLFMDDNYWNTFEGSQDLETNQAKEIILEMLIVLLESEKWNKPELDEWENRYESIRNNEKLLKKVIQICIKRKIPIVLYHNNRHTKINFANEENVKTLIDMIRTIESLQINGHYYSGSLHFTNGMTREMRNSVADKLERVMKSIKDDEDKSKKGDDFPSDGRKKSKRSKRSKRKNKSRKK